MCVYKNHAFICFGRPLSWLGTKTVHHFWDSLLQDQITLQGRKQKLCIIFETHMQTWKFTSSLVQDQITLHSRKQKMCIVFEIHIKEQKFTSTQLQGQSILQGRKQNFCFVYISLYKIYVFPPTGPDNFT